MINKCKFVCKQRIKIYIYIKRARVKCEISMHVICDGADVMFQTVWTMFPIKYSQPETRPKRSGDEHWRSPGFFVFFICIVCLFSTRVLVEFCANRTLNWIFLFRKSVYVVHMFTMKCANYFSVCLIFIQNYFLSN